VFTDEEAVPEAFEETATLPLPEDAVTPPVVNPAEDDGLPVGILAEEEEPTGDLTLEAMLPEALGEESELPAEVLPLEVALTHVGL